MKRHLTLIPASRYLLPFLLFYLAGCAASGPGAQSASQPQSTSFFLFNTLYFFALVYLGYYMLVLRPKVANERLHVEFVKGLKKGSEVMTTSGIYGKVVAVQGEIVTIEVDSSTRLRVHSEFIAPPKLASSAPSTAPAQKSAQG